MLEKLEKLVEEARKAAEIIKNHTGLIRILSHYDADGITSAAIISKSLYREGKSFHLTPIKQLNKKNIDEIAGYKEEMIIFLDFGSGQLKSFGHLTDKKLIIVDHHQPQGEKRDFITHLNPLDFRIEENISSAGISYILSIAINKDNKDLSELAIIGAIGDSQMQSLREVYGLMGLNKEFVKDAVSSKKIKLDKGLRIWGRTTRPIHKALEYSVDPHIPNVSGSESNSIQFLKELGIETKNHEGKWRTLVDLTLLEQKKLASGIIAERVKTGHDNPDWIFGDVYELLDRGEFTDANELTTMINACGKLGEASLGISFCMNDPSSYPRAKKLLEKYKKAIRSGLNIIQKEKDSIVRETDKSAYFLLGDRISEHIISNVISMISKNHDFGKPIFALVKSEEGIKVSARASESLIEAGINLKEIISETASFLGGEGGGHKGASGATIPEGCEDDFIKKADSLIPDNLKGIKNTQSNINHKAEIEQVKVETNEEANARSDGQEAKREGIDQKGQNNRREEGGSKERGKEVERKGLVRYFSS